MCSFFHICHDRGHHVCCGLLGKLTGGYGDDRVKIAAWDTKHPNFPAFSLIVSLRQSRKHLKMNLPKGFRLSAQLIGWTSSKSGQKLVTLSPLLIRTNRTHSQSSTLQRRTDRIHSQSPSSSCRIRFKTIVLTRLASSLWSCRVMLRKKNFSDWFLHVLHTKRKVSKVGRSYL